jgi:hypothetical protein
VFRRQLKRERRRVWGTVVDSELNATYFCQLPDLTVDWSITATSREFHYVLILSSGTVKDVANESMKPGKSITVLTPSVNANCDPILFGFLSQLALAFLADFALISHPSPHLPDSQKLIFIAVLRR